MDLHERLEPVAGAKQGEPERHLDDRICAPAGALRGEERVVLHVEDARGLADALEQDAEPTEVEGRVVQHGRAQEPQAELRFAADPPVEPVGMIFEVLAGGGRFQIKVQLVDDLPGFQRDDVAARARILARRRDRSPEADGHPLVEREVALHGVAVGRRERPAQLGEALLLAGGDHHRLPALLRRQL